MVEGFSVGINAGGGVGVRVLGNKLLNNTRSITAFQVETDGAGNNFGMACTDLQIRGNAMVLPLPSDGGVMLFDGPQGVSIGDNTFAAPNATVLASSVVAFSDQVTMVGNRWNGETALAADLVVIGGSSVLRAPEMADQVIVPVAATSVAGLVGQHQFDVSGQVTFIKVSAGGSFYANATVVIAGGGTGAQATAYIRGGAIIGVAVVSGGSGYSAATTTVTIVGDGQGAAMQAFVGLPVLEGRRVTLLCGSATQLLMNGTVGQFDNWTGGTLTIPARSEVACVGASGLWRAVSFIALDYLCPAANGSVSLRSTQGDVTIQPRGGGFVRVVSDSESVGYVTSLGRGSPEGVVVAPPGSDYRNLDGVAGQSFWVKQSGTGSTGWSAIG